MSSEAHTDTSVRLPERSSSWAPWWAYVLVIVPANVGKEQFLPSGADWWLRGTLTALVVVGGIALITALYRVGRDERIP
jgi:hypothetical protein